MLQKMVSDPEWLSSDKWQQKKNILRDLLTRYMARLFKWLLCTGIHISSPGEPRPTGVYHPPGMVTLKTKPIKTTFPILQITSVLYLIAER